MLCTAKFWGRYLHLTVRKLHLEVFSLYENFKLQVYGLCFSVHGPPQSCTVVVKNEYLEEAGLGLHAVCIQGYSGGERWRAILPERLG